MDDFMNIDRVEAKKTNSSHLQSSFKRFAMFLKEHSHYHHQPGSPLLDIEMPLRKDLSLLRSTTSHYLYNGHRQSTVIISWQKSNAGHRPWTIQNATSPRRTVLKHFHTYTDFMRPIGPSRSDAKKYVKIDSKNRV